MSICAVDHNASIASEIPPSSTQTSPAASGEETSEPGKITNSAGQEKAVTACSFDESGEKTKGVVRLLGEGHFKGVADVRLRINFFDDITALEQHKTAQVAQDGVSGLMQSVNGEIDSILQSEDLGEQAAAVITEASDTFNAGIPQVVDDFVAEGASGTDRLISRLQSTFDEFIANVTSALNTSPEPDTNNSIESAAQPGDKGYVEVDIPAAEANYEASPEESSQLILQQFVANLIETFNSRLNELETALAGVSVLPELSQPRGNGVAFEKFLAVYNELRGVGIADPQPAPIDLVI